MAQIKLECAPIDDPIFANVSIEVPGLFGDSHWIYYGAIFKSLQGEFTLRGKGEVHKSKDLMDLIRYLENYRYDYR